MCKDSSPFYSPGTLSPSAAEDLDEGPSELYVEGGVDDRVEGTVDIPQPRESTVKPGRHVACPAVGVQYVGHKERQPADEKHPWSSQRAETYGERTKPKTQEQNCKEQLKQSLFVVTLACISMLG